MIPMVNTFIFSWPKSRNFSNFYGVLLFLLVFRTISLPEHRQEASWFWTASLYRQHISRKREMAAHFGQEGKPWKLSQKNFHMENPAFPQLSQAPPENTFKMVINTLKCARKKRVGVAIKDCARKKEAYPCWCNMETFSIGMIPAVSSFFLDRSEGHTMQSDKTSGTTQCQACVLHLSSISLLWI